MKPYQIPYRVMLPKRAEAINLLVPVAFSASHVAYSSVRMEPQYMILGQAAGVAAKMAVESGKPVQAIDAGELAATLRKQGAVLEYVPSPQAPAVQTFPKLVGRTSWSAFFGLIARIRKADQEVRPTVWSLFTPSRY